MQELTLDHAQSLLARALEKATQDYQRPVCVAIVDAQGFLTAFARMTGAPVRSIQISQGKAYTASRMGVTTTAFLARLHKEQIQASDFCDPGFTSLPGGSPLKNADGKMIGAIGISGLAAAEDQAITDFVAGIVAAA
ncbi:MAG: heme-binding protein [Burkholderiales bacterium]